MSPPDRPKGDRHTAQHEAASASVRPDRAAAGSAPTLAQVAGHNARWLALGQVARVALQFGGVAMLSRLLPAGDFGLMAMVVAVTNFAVLWRDLGTASALLREPVLAEATTCSVFWLNLGIGLGLAALLALTRGPLAAALGDPRLAPLLLWVALCFPLQGAAAAHQALLERAGRFRALAGIEVAAGLAGLAVAVAAALRGAGASSLVWQTLAVAATSAALLWWRSGWSPRGGVVAAELRRLLHFSGHLTAFNLVNYVTRNADSLLIGRLLGAAPLGAYSLAMRITLFPVQNLTWTASRALLPVLNRPGAAPGEAAALYLRSLGLVVVLAAPLMAGLWVLRADFVVLVLGPNWAPVAGLLAWLAPVGLVQSAVSTVGPVFLASGRSDTLLRLGLLSLALIVGSLLLAVRHGIEAVAAAYLAANLLQAGPCLWLAARQLGLTPAAMLAPLRAPLSAAAGMLGLLWAAQASAALSAWPPLLRLALLAAVGALAYLGLLRRLDAGALDDLLKLLHGRRAT